LHEKLLVIRKDPVLSIVSLSLAKTRNREHWWHIYLSPPRIALNASLLQNMKKSLKGVR
jgi:hypothetical protein